MNRLVVAACVLLGATCVLFSITRAGGAKAGSRTTERTAGAWTASAKDDDPNELQFSLQFEHDGNMGMGFARTAFTGLTPEQVESASRVPVTFEMRREAGTIAFEGTFRGGRGAGEFDFTPNPDYRRALEALGVSLVDEDGDRHDLFSLAYFDVSTDFIRSMQRIGYKVGIDQLVQFRIFRVDPEYVRAMADVGFDHLTAERLVETKIHGVSPEYVRDMRAHGEDLSLDEYVQSRIFQVTPAFADEMKKLGYGGLDHDTLVAFRIHGVTPEFIDQLKDLGYKRVSADDLVAMRIHGVTPEFIRRVEKAGYHDVPIDKLVQMRIFGIDPEMVGALDGQRR